jgi:PPOX class probable F420-dependent enzyme
MLADYPSVVTQLDEELVGWLTSVNEAGQPQASPVWHVTDGGEIVVYNRANARRLTNLRSNPKVAYNLRGDPRGDKVVSMEGTARVDPEAAAPLGVPAYMTKYRDEMIRLGWSPEEYDEEFPVAIRITVTRVRAQ